MKDEHSECGNPTEKLSQWQLQTLHSAVAVGMGFGWAYIGVYAMSNSHIAEGSSRVQNPKVSVQKIVLLEFSACRCGQHMAQPSVLPTPCLP